MTTDQKKMMTRPKIKTFACFTFVTQQFYLGEGRSEIYSNFWTKI